MELKANELRLNNFVTLNHKVREELFHNQIHAQNEYFEVLTIYSDGDILLKLDDENVELDVKEIEPIPLTEEWLFKFGFKHSGNGFFIHTESLLELANIGNDFFLAGINGISLNTIYHTHQLQNLYFALTNKELEIKM